MISDEDVNQRLFFSNFVMKRFPVTEHKRTEEIFINTHMHGCSGYILIHFSFLKVSGIKGNQFESCLANAVHQSDSLAISLKA